MGGFVLFVPARLVCKCFAFSMLYGLRIQILRTVQTGEYSW